MFSTFLVRKGKTVHRYVANRMLSEPAVNEIDSIVHYIENNFDPCKLAEAAGASFVARGTTYDADGLDELAIMAIEKKGFSLVEVMVAITIMGVAMFYFIMYVY